MSLEKILDKAIRDKKRYQERGDYFFDNKDYSNAINEYIFTIKELKFIISLSANVDQVEELGSDFLFQYYNYIIKIAISYQILNEEMKCLFLARKVDQVLYKLNNYYNKFSVQEIEQLNECKECLDIIIEDFPSKEIFDSKMLKVYLSSKEEIIGEDGKFNELYQVIDECNEEFRKVLKIYFLETRWYRHEESGWISYDEYKKNNKNNFDTNYSTKYIFGSLIAILGIGVFFLFNNGNSTSSSAKKFDRSRNSKNSHGISTKDKPQSSNLSIKPSKTIYYSNLLPVGQYSFYERALKKNVSYIRQDNEMIGAIYGQKTTTSVTCFSATLNGNKVSVLWWGDLGIFGLKGQRISRTYDINTFTADNSQPKIGINNSSAVNFCQQSK